MKAFTFADFNTETPSEIKSEFITDFDEKKPAPAGEPMQTISVEDQARAIFEDAFVQGEKAGFEMGMKKVDPIIKRLNNYLSELGFYKEEVLERSKRLSTELALSFAEAIVLKECENNREVVLDMVKKALELCEERTEVLIRMRKEDVELIAPEEMSHLKIIKDDTMKEPGFIIETNFGDIDGRVSVQIAQLRKEFIHGRDH